MADDATTPPIGKLKTAITAPGDTIITPKGNIVTKQEWLKAQQNGLPFATHQDYANYVDGWAHPVTPQTTGQPAKPTTPPISDKAKGKSNTFYPPGQGNSPDPPEIKSTRY